MSHTDTTAPSLPARAGALAMRGFDWLLRWALEREHGTYAFAAFRIVYGLIILAVLATSFADRHYLWGVGSRFIDPVASDRGYPIFFDAVFNKSSPMVFDIAYVVLALLAVVFAAGWKTRWVTPLLLLFWIGLSVNSTLLTNGGDTLMRITLFFALFANLSKRWSVDAWLARGKEPKPVTGWRSRIPGWLPPLLHNTALVLCGYQILLIYASSALLKLQGSEWLDGTAVYYSLAIEVFRPFPWLNDLVSLWDWPVYLLTYTTFGLQLLFPIFLVWRPTRVVALLGITGVHLGIALFLGLWPFSLAMIALDFLFVRDATWVWFEGLVKEWWARGMTAFRGWRSRQSGVGPRRRGVGASTPVD